MNKALCREHLQYVSSTADCSMATQAVKGTRALWSDGTLPVSRALDGLKRRNLKRAGISDLAFRSSASPYLMRSSSLTFASVHLSACLSVCLLSVQQRNTNLRHLNYCCESTRFVWQRSDLSFFQRWQRIQLSSGMLCCLTWKIFTDVFENTLKMNYVHPKHYYNFATSQDVIFKIILKFISSAVRTSEVLKAIFI